mgnify:CR=1 FL=1
MLLDHAIDPDFVATFLRRGSQEDDVPIERRALRGLLLVMRWPPARAKPWLMIVSIAVVMTPPGVALVWLWGLVAVPGVEGFGDVFTLTWSVFLISLIMTAINRLIAPAVAAPLAALDTACAALMRDENIPSEQVKIRHSADICYIGQSYHLEVPIDLAAPDPIGAMFAAFRVAHAIVYGHATMNPAKVVNLRSVHSAQTGIAAAGASHVPTTVAPVTACKVLVPPL